MKIAIVDFETTGLDPEIHEIIEIGMVIVDADTLEIEDEFSIKVRPVFPNLATQEAIAVNGYNHESWKDAVYLERALYLMFLKSKTMVFASWNVTFDWSFMHRALRKNRIEDPFHRRKFDIASMAYTRIFGAFGSYWNDKEMSLREVCLRFDLPEESFPHTALNGAQCAYQVFKKIQS